MTSHTPSPRKPNPSRGALLLLALILLAILGVLFNQSFRPGVAHFANDAPIGTMLAQPYKLPESYRGIWNDLLWLGAWNGNFNPNVSGLAMGALGRMYYHKFMIPIGLFFLGISAGVCFQRFGFPRWVCVLGGLAAALNMNAFSNACWGLPSRAHAMGAAFLAIAAFHSSFGRFPVIKIILAGLAIGLGISEGGDNGAIFAIVVGCYGFFRALTTEGAWRARIGRGVGSVAVAAVVAAIFAAQTLNIFINTAVKGVVGMSDDSLTPEQKWDFATQGSLHPKETLRVIIPGLYGYRMDAEKGGNYWGRVGESLSAPGTSRHSGAGEHAGVIVVLIALWALHHSCRGQGGAFSETERRAIWFFAGTAGCCLLLAWGKWGPLYQLLYALPYFHTIRLPLKWMHPFHLCLLVLFAYGLTGLGRQYLRSDRPRKQGSTPTIMNWWSRASDDERRWTWISIGLACVSIVGGLLYFGAQRSVVEHLAKASVFGSPEEIATFSRREVLIYLIFLIPSLAVVLSIISGRFVGNRLVVAAVAIGMLLGIDLVRANSNWMLYFDYHDRYALNPPLQFLKDHSAQYRVAKVPQRPILLALRSTAEANRNNPSILQQLGQHAASFQQGLNYTHDQWQQNHFPYYNIRCLDMSQEPRLPADKLAFNTALAAAAARGHATREYEMTSTRYFVGMAGDSQILNATLDSQARRFSEGLRFNLIPTRPDSPSFGDLRVRADTNGPYSILEFAGAIPRASLFSHWEVVTNDAHALSKLAMPDFDPATTLLLHEPIPASTSVTNLSTSAAGNQPVIVPTNTSHRILISVNAAERSILLLTDRFDPAWNVRVDGQAAKMLRCNYLMRGVEVPAGPHTIEFSYHPGMGGFWLMVGCVALGVCLLAFLALVDRSKLPS